MQMYAPCLYITLYPDEGYFTRTKHTQVFNRCDWSNEAQVVKTALLLFPFPLPFPLMDGARKHNEREAQ